MTSYIPLDWPKMTKRTYKWSKRDLMVTPIKEAMLFTKELDLIAEPRARRAS